MLTRLCARDPMIGEWALEIHHAALVSGLCVQIRLLRLLHAVFVEARLCVSSRLVLARLGDAGCPWRAVVPSSAAGLGTVGSCGARRDSQFRWLGPSLKIPVIESGAAWPGRFGGPGHAGGW